MALLGTWGHSEGETRGEQAQASGPGPTRLLPATLAPSGGASILG